MNSSFKNSLSAQSSESITITSLSLTEMFVPSQLHSCTAPSAGRLRCVAAWGGQIDLFQQKYFSYILFH